MPKDKGMVVMNSSSIALRASKIFTLNPERKARSNIGSSSMDTQMAYTDINHISYSVP